MAKTVRNISERWAYDIDKNPIDQGEIWDADVINQSIEMILGTYFGERLFVPSFGFGVEQRMFEVFNPEDAESLLDDIANAIKRWEDRVILVESKMRIIADVDRNFIVLVVPYIIKRTNISSVFKKKIYSNS